MKKQKLNPSPQIEINSSKNFVKRSVQNKKNNKISDEDTFLVFNIFNQFEIVDSYCATEKIVKLDNNSSLKS